MTFGEKLKNARLANNLSQIELAEKLGVSEKAIYNYEQTGAFPRKAKLLKLAEGRRWMKPAPPLYTICDSLFYMFALDMERQYD